MNTPKLKGITIASEGVEAVDPNENPCVVDESTLEQIKKITEALGEPLKLRIGEMRLEHIIGTVSGLRIEDGKLLADFEPLPDNERGLALAAVDPADVVFRIDCDFTARDGVVHVERVRSAVIAEDDAPDPEAKREALKRAVVETLGTELQAVRQRITRLESRIDAEELEPVPDHAPGGTFEADLQATREGVARLERDLRRIGR